MILFLIYIILETERKRERDKYEWQFTNKTDSRRDSMNY